MGCNNTRESSNEIDKIKSGYNDLIKSVEDEMNEYKNQLKKISYDRSTLENLKFKYNQKILKIFHEEDNYSIRINRNIFLKQNMLNDAEDCMNNNDVLSKLKPGVIIQLKEIEKKKNDEINAKLKISDENMEKCQELEQKIELCQNQIKTYEKEKQAAIIAKREEIRNNLLQKNINNGVLSMYNERQGFNKQIDKDIVNKIHNDYS